MTDNDSDQRTDDVAGERTSAFRADFSNAQDAAATAGAEGQLFGAQPLPQGSGSLVVKRRPERRLAVLARPGHHDGWSSPEYRYLPR